MLIIAMAIYAADSKHILIANHHWRAAHPSCSEAVAALQLQVEQGLDVMTQSVTTVTSDKLHDIGVYGIADPASNRAYHVYFIRPSMRSVADPYYADGELVHRK